MPVFETFSKRQKRANGGFSDVYQYDELPSTLRTQITHVIHDVIGTRHMSKNRQDVSSVYSGVVSVLRREYGVFHLDSISHGSSDVWYDEVVNLIARGSTDHALDVTEILFRYAHNHIRDNQSYLGRDNERFVDNGIDELNIRFKEAGVGYQFLDGQIIRMDSELIHQEAVKPALRLLNTEEYAGAHQEFINAYDHYKAGNNKEALNDCYKAFESTMKAICDKREWTYDPGDSAKKLVAICLQNGLIPSSWQNQFNHLQGLLESSIPTPRNKMSGHGQGATPKEVPDHIVAYMLHMTASTLVFLTTAEQSLNT